MLGRGERVDILHAALINGISSHVLDFDDTHARAVHPSAPVLPAAARARRMAARRAARNSCTHSCWGSKPKCRIGLSVFPEHYEAGWHITGTAGVFGAAAAAGKLLGLDEQQMTWALGIAATQSAGLREMFGSMCKSLHPGRAAQNGLTAALLAAKDFTSSERAIEAPRGFAHVLSTKFDPEVITEGLGERFELLSNMYKPYACGLVVHAAIDGCIQLRNEQRLAPEAIEAVDLTVCPIVLELTGKTKPQTGLEGKFSVYHAAAAAIVHGAAGEAQFSDACVRDPRVIALRERVSRGAEDPPAQDRGACFHPAQRRRHALAATSNTRSARCATDERRRPRGEIPRTDGGSTRRPAQDDEAHPAVLVGRRTARTPGRSCARPSRRAVALQSAMSIDTGIRPNPHGIPM